MGIQVPTGNYAVHDAPSYRIDATLVSNWIIHHEKRSKAFPAHSDGQIIDLVTRGLEDGSLLVAHHNGSPVGLLYFQADNADSELFVHAIIADTHGTFKLLLNLWSRHPIFHNYSVVAIRGKRTRTFHTHNFNRYLHGKPSSTVAQ